MEVMTLTMDTTQIPTLKQMEDFVNGAIAISLTCSNRQEAYGYIEQVLVAHGYSKLTKPNKGLVRSYLVQVTGFGPAQLTRLIRQHRQFGCIALAVRTQPTFAGKYLPEDIVELARIDELHEDLSGPAMCRILRRGGH